jgi:hypothetical protein
VTDFAIQAESSPSTSFSKEVFTTSAQLYSIGREYNDTSLTWSDTGLRLNATYYLDFQSAEGSTTFQFRSHICDLVGGTLSYKLKVEGGVVALSEDQTSDGFKKM